jgi:alkylation response protein AidB-like acyl-CoA dehydrogenase|tara:strand:- start:83 stop:1255 length:1173 start_codon:yes stop_codon:yes gene_type:complete
MTALETEEVASETALRSEIRDWFEIIMPELQALRDPTVPLTENEDFAMRRRYSELLAQDGWASLAWDRHWGGRGAGFAERLVFAQEAARSDAPDSLSRLGVDIIGPAINVLCDADQSQHFIPGILDASVIWCQGFSEPNAGSDLASLSTRAALDASGNWIINGQKVWTTIGQYADMCLVLARTETDERPHRGISSFAVPMTTPGVTVRPIDQITGGHDFCEVFYDNVVVGPEALIGERGDGWKFAMTALGFERSINFMARQVKLAKQVNDLLAQIRRHRDAVPSRLKDRAVEIHVRTIELQATVSHLMAAIDRGESPGPDNNASKVFWSETFQQMADLGLELEQTVPGFRDPLTVDWAQMYLSARASTIYAGTSEIQRNIVAERGLGLPK